MNLGKCLTTNEPDKTAVTSGFDSLILSGGFAGYSDVMCKRITMDKILRRYKERLIQKRYIQELFGHNSSKTTNIHKRYLKINENP